MYAKDPSVSTSVNFLSRPILPHMLKRAFNTIQFLLPSEIFNKSFIDTCFFNHKEKFPYDLVYMYILY